MEVNFNRKQRIRKMLWLMLLVYYCGSAGGLKDEGNPLFEFAYRRTYLEKLDQCFCEVNYLVLTYLELYMC